MRAGADADAADADARLDTTLTLPLCHLSPGPHNHQPPAWHYSTAPPPYNLQHTLPTAPYTNITVQIPTQPHCHLTSSLPYHPAPACHHSTAPLPPPQTAGRWWLLRTGSRRLPACTAADRRCAAWPRMKHRLSCWHRGRGPAAARAAASAVVLSVTQPTAAAAAAQ